jgi:hypothetical protein
MECGASELGRRAKALIERRLKDPAFALSAGPEDAGLANLAIDSQLVNRRTESVLSVSIWQNVTREAMGGQPWV